MALAGRSDFLALTADHTVVGTTVTQVDGPSRQLNAETHVESPRSEATTIRPQGDLDLGNVPRFRAELHAAIARSADIGSRIVDVDLAAVDFVDSAGIGALIGGLRRMRQREGSLRLTNPPSELREVLLITGLSTVFDVVDS